MSFYSDASLVMIPSGYKDAKVYSAKPVDGSGDLDFSRGSDIEATRVNANGYIEKAQVNLLLQSNSFSTSPWESNTINREATLTSGQTGYDGSSDAWLVLDTTGIGQHQIASGSLTLGGVYTSSVYAKAYSSSRYLGLAGFGLAGANEMPVFDLVNGTVDTGTTSTYFIDANIESAGSGWYRCSVTFKYTGTSQLSITLCDTATDNGLTGYVYTGTGTNGIYIQDAQLNYGLVAQTYQETTTAAVVSGITNDMPRLNYDPANPTCPSLLLEPSRTNLVTSSEFIDSSAGWILSSVSVTDNATTSPEGVVNAAKLTSTANFSKTIASLSLSGSTTYTASFYVKDISAGSSTRFVVFDQTNVATLKNENYSADISTTQWTRLSYSFTTTTAATVQIQFVRDLNSGEEVYVYGFQCEAGSYGTSLIPTYGSSATRNADFKSDNDLVDTAISFGANDDFTLFYEGSFNDLSSTSNMIMGGGRQQLGASYKNYWWAQNATSMRIVGEAETLMAYTSMSITDNTNVKLLVKRSGSVIDFFVNGSKLTTTQQTTNTAFTFRSLGWAYNNAVYKVSGDIKKALVFESALTDAECIALTTL